MTGRCSSILADRFDFTGLGECAFFFRRCPFGAPRCLTSKPNISRMNIDSVMPRAFTICLNLCNSSSSRYDEILFNLPSNFCHLPFHNKFVAYLFGNFITYIFTPCIRAQGHRYWTTFFSLLICLYFHRLILISLHLSASVFLFATLLPCHDLSLQIRITCLPPLAGAG